MILCEGEFSWHSGLSVGVICSEWFELSFTKSFASTGDCSFGFRASKLLVSNKAR